jgi:hypothetical protein
MLRRFLERECTIVSNRDDREDLFVAMIARSHEQWRARDAAQIAVQIAVQITAKYSRRKKEIESE